LFAVVFQNVSLAWLVAHHNSAEQAIGGSRGIGRRIVEAGIRNGTRVLAVARQEAPLQQLAQEVPGVKTVVLDATDEGAPSEVFDVLTPDILILRRCPAGDPARCFHAGQRNG
jgi:nucleoside-diphosphate-sugar epimerase